MTLLACICAVAAVAIPPQDHKSADWEKVVHDPRASYDAMFVPIRKCLLHTIDPDDNWTYCPASPMRRAEYAVGVWQAIQLAEAIFIEEHRSTLQALKERPDIRLGWAENFWRIEYLARRLMDVMIQFGLTEGEILSKIAHAKEGFAREGILLDAPLSQRFSDVPPSHWADDSIHELRKAGVLLGHPDNTFRS